MSEGKREADVEFPLTSMKGAAGMLVGSFKLNPQRRPILVWPNVLLTLKETILNFDYMNRVNKTIIEIYIYIFIFLRV